jgi:hypothetical protein
MYSFTDKNCLFLCNVWIMKNNGKLRWNLSLWAFAGTPPS